MIDASGRVAVIVGALVALLLGLTACGGSGSDEGGGSSSDSDPTVEVKDFAYTPANLTVPTGATVTWTFEDSAVHDVMADDKSFSSPLLNDGKTYQFTFTKPGSYPYTCSVHPYMMGALTVQ